MTFIRKLSKNSLELGKEKEKEKERKSSGNVKVTA
jgi:hypothetical protein